MGGTPGIAWSRPSCAGCCRCGGGGSFPYCAPSRSARRAGCTPLVEAVEGAERPRCRSGGGAFPGGWASDHLFIGANGESLRSARRVNCGCGTVKRGLLEARCALGTIPVDGRGLPPAHPAHGRPLVSVPAWERDHGRALGAVNLRASRAAVDTFVWTRPMHYRGAGPSRPRQAVEAGRARRRFPPGRRRGRLADGAARLRDAGTVGAGACAWGAGLLTEVGRSRARGPPLLLLLDGRRSTAGRLCAIRTLH